MNEPFQEIIHVDGCFDLVLGGILFVLFCVILVTSVLNLRSLLRPAGGADDPSLFRWRLHLSLAASCIAGMVAVLAAIQAACSFFSWNKPSGTRFRRQKPESWADTSTSSWRGGAWRRWG